MFNRDRLLYSFKSFPLVIFLSLMVKNLFMSTLFKILYTSIMSALKRPYSSDDNPEVNVKVKKYKKTSRATSNIGYQTNVVFESASGSALEFLAHIFYFANN